MKLETCSVNSTFSLEIGTTPIYRTWYFKTYQTLKNQNDRLWFQNFFFSQTFNFLIYWARIWLHRNNNKYYNFLFRQVPTLNNVGLGMNAAELGPPGMPPSFKFVQDNTRQMIQQNSDYKVPQSGELKIQFQFPDIFPKNILWLVIGRSEVWSFCYCKAMIYWELEVLILLRLTKFAFVSI